MKLPQGILTVEHYYGQNGNCCLIGVVHDEVNPPELSDFLADGINLNPQAVCIESPHKRVSATEHMGAKQYCDANGAELLSIDCKLSEYEGGLEYYIEANKNTTSVPINWDTAREDEEYKNYMKGKEDTINPEWSEFNKEREQMMALEVLEAMQQGYRNLAVVVGDSHCMELKQAISTFENKYNY